ncbi:PqqD family protein [Clostridium beijerinckii]|uniref:PqqD family protein n=1 Tax=Clostridium TaxID=1485 RepID=UPI000B4014BC|nr:MULTISPECIES: PqqD family protein [Clostridium]NOW07500.1 hypothetical protein [Clostridium beijerinckii]NYC04727.1 hypothetical protein [Clostridium beijerinckii]OVE67254.1 hypothetical protein CCS79_14090 [Clostridium diolis]UYZ35670.1 PqqD family protein [Clostridium beijerinckii]
MILERNMFVQYRSINGKKFLAKNYKAYELDEIGEIVWESIDGNTDIYEICEKISKKYSVDINIVKNDVEEFIRDLLSKNLIEEVV